MRNPKWNRDEVILALDLFFKLKPGQIHARNPEIIELSRVLNRLPIHKERPDEVKFRNPNGVGLKLSNFLAIDPQYRGKGMESYSKLDKEIFDEYFNKRNELIEIANEIKDAVINDDLNDELYKIDVEEDISVKEGQVLYKLHRYKERNSTIIRKKKDIYFKKYGRLECEICGFDFVKFYGELGKGFIECHHKKPLYNIGKQTKTTLNDLALVCANCHRMLHKDLRTLSIESLKNKINKLKR